VDEHPLWLEAVEQVLQRVSVRVIGKAGTFEAGTNLISELAPELLVTEIATSEGETSGIGWLLGIREQFPEIKIIVLSMSNDPADIQAAFSAGAVAFVVKKAHPDDLAVAVRQAYEHSIYLPGFATANGNAPMEEVETDLTRRELEILCLVAEGHSNADLARMLWVTEQTIKFHLSNIYRKLEVSNRTEASRWAQVHGLLQPLPTAV
jgi:DNA-binding NarL/FixJ family response regulator